ncbi:MAG: selenium-dependent molybdenum cofactor biosynthesis protein YqeB [Anaerolineae bacterium]
MELSRMLVLIKGAGDLASGVAARLHRCGFRVVMTELPQPLMVRRAVCFGEAVYEGEVVVEGIVGRRVPDVPAAQQALAAGVIPVLVDPPAACRAELAPLVLVDGIMAKRNTGTSRADAPLVIALGPGFAAGVDCHAVIETQRGHWLGRVYWQGTALPDNGVPGDLGSATTPRRVLRAPADGILVAHAGIGEPVHAEQIIAEVAGIPLRAGCAGVLRGLIHPGVYVTAGMKVGDVDPRGERAHCFTISDKSLAVAGGVLEAILTWHHRMEHDLCR